MKLSRILEQLAEICVIETRSSKTQDVVIVAWDADDEV